MRAIKIGRALVLCAPLGGWLAGCGDATAPDVPRAPTNTVVYTVKDRPELGYTLVGVEGTPDAPTNTASLVWTRDGELLVSARVTLTPGTSSFARQTYWASIPGVFSESGPFEKPCEGSCTGSVTITADFAHRTRKIDLALKDEVKLPECTVRHRAVVRSAPEYSTSYEACSDSAPCRSLADCCCQHSLPCSGSIARSASDLCVNPDFHWTQREIRILGNAELPD